MPYVKRYKKRSKKRGYSSKKRSSKPWYMRKYNAYELAGKAWSAAKRLRGLINVEKKKFDTILGTSTSGTLVNCVAIPQGDGDQTRDGNSVLLKSVYMRGTLANNSASPSTRFRIMLIRDLQQIADTAPSATDILDGGLSGDFIRAPLNNETVGRYEILMDKIFVINQPFASAVFQRNLKEFFPMNHHVRFNGTAGTDIQKGGVYFLVIHDQPGGTLPTISLDIRSSYYDN